jgi:hypothetical protein
VIFKLNLKLKFKKSNKIAYITFSALNFDLISQEITQMQNAKKS